MKGTEWGRSSADPPPEIGQGREGGRLDREIEHPAIEAFGVSPIPFRDAARLKQEEPPDVVSPGPGPPKVHRDGLRLQPRLIHGVTSGAAGPISPRARSRGVRSAPRGC